MPSWKGSRIKIRNCWHRKPLLVNSTLATWLLLEHTSQKKWQDFTVALSWKTSATITNVSSQPLAKTVEVAEVKTAIAAVQEAGDVVGGRHQGGGRLGYQGKKTETNGINVADPTQSFTDNEWTLLGPNGGRAYVTQQRLHINGRVRRADGRGGGRGGNDRNISVADVNHNTTQSTETEKNHGHNQDTVRGGDRGGCNGEIFGRGTYHQYWLSGALSMLLTYLEASMSLMLVKILLVMPRSKRKYEPYCITEKTHGQNQDTGRGGDRSGRNGGRFGRGAYQRYWLFGRYQCFSHIWKHRCFSC